MNLETDNKQLIAAYLSALSGHPKTPEVVARFVDDPHLVKHIEEVEAGFPSYELVAEQTIAEGDLVVVRGTFRGTHRGAFAGIGPTGKRVSGGLIIIYRIAGGRIAEHWLQFDMFGLLAQLKAAPAAAV